MLDQALVRSSRFIPAGAGNTPACACILQFITVYPRWRGEHFEATIHCHMASGLSPLARGTLEQVTSKYKQ